MGRQLTVTGRGGVSAPYDAAELALAASARASKPADATARAAYGMSRIREAVLAHGVAESDLATRAVSLQPVHDPWPTVVAYEATLGLTVSVTDLGHLGSLLVDAVEAGGDGARVEGIAFRHHDIAGLQRGARASAYADARAKAEQYALLAGRTLGEVCNLTDHVSDDGRPGVRLVSVAGPPIDTGDGRVDAVVTVSWALRSGADG